MIKSGKRGALSSALLTAARNPPVTEGSNAATVPASLDAKAVMAAAFAASREPAESDGDILVKKGAASAAAFRRSLTSEAQPEALLPETPAKLAIPVLPHGIPGLSQTTVKATSKGRARIGIAACTGVVALCAIVVLSSVPPHPDKISIAEPRLIAKQESPAQVVASPKRPVASIQDAAGLVARGNALLDIGDIVSARLYYEQAADAGDGRAAMLMGATFDPVFLGRAGARGLRGDVANAAAWYRRARDLGERDAVPLLAALEPR
jgi:hypothetical protein